MTRQRTKRFIAVLLGLMLVLSGIPEIALSGLDSIKSYASEAIEVPTLSETDLASFYTYEE